LARFLIPLESAHRETRVSATPETVKKFISLGCSIAIEKGAGILSGFADEEFTKVGGELIEVGEDKAWSQCDVVLCVQPPKEEFLVKLRSGALIVGLLSPYGNERLGKILKGGGLSALALELLPRISRAQSSDALSSQANISGYKAVLLAAGALDRYFPMLMTAAGTVQPSKVVILGAGVAGLQAIATAKRLGAVVFVSDIRSEVKEQVESLGGKFIDPPQISEKPAEAGGYAKQVSNEFLLAQRQLLSDHLAEADVAICTAQVPGKNAPRLIDEEMLDRMRSGSVVIDLAVSQGGNCFGTKPFETIERKGVKLIGASDLPCSVSNHASSLYSRNLLALLNPIITNGSLTLNTEDELINGSLISNDGDIRYPEILLKGGED
tara:strand:- start:2591 stop:3733 length:1143 start_codon:yes stop_codon:yes gene_type:complete